jgi:hypothetical protein
MNKFISAVAIFASCVSFCLMYPFIRLYITKCCEKSYLTISLNTKLRSNLNIIGLQRQIWSGILFLIQLLNYLFRLTLRIHLLDLQTYFQTLVPGVEILILLRVLSLPSRIPMIVMVTWVKYLAQIAFLRSTPSKQK